jgi:LAS superfamily LD-carboxypeptidase LdcB
MGLGLLLLTGCSGTSGTPAVVTAPVGTSIAQSVTLTTPSVTVTSPTGTPTRRPAVPGTPSTASPLGRTSSRATSSGETTAERASNTVPPVATTGPTQASADVNVAGPDNGPSCAAAKEYSDEATTGLRPDVKAAWLATKKRAAALGVTLCLNDGKRSAAQQVALFKLYVKQYGAAAARDYVLSPARSAHVKGYAVDVQPASAYRWLQSTKGKFGWCRIYDNEAWHFEYSTVYASSGCPARQPKPSD